MSKGERLLAARHGKVEDDDHQPTEDAVTPQATDDSGVFVGLPIWARVVGLVGIPGTIALFAVWVGSQSIPKLQTEIVALREAMQAQNVVSQTIAAKSEEQTRLLQKICSAQFKDESEKQRCFDH